MKPKLIYCQDALCGWCYGFSPVIDEIQSVFAKKLDFEAFAGGMVRGEQVKHIREKADFILGAYPRVEQMTGAKFGEAYLKHLRRPEKSSWHPDSEPPAVALAIFKSMQPENSISFACDLNEAMHRDGLDLSILENYAPILEKYDLPVEEFLVKMEDETFVERAHYDFFLCQQLQVNGYPTVLLQTDQLHFYLVSRGYSDFETLKRRVENVLGEIAGRLN